MSLSLFSHFFLVHWHVEREIKIHFEMLARRVFIICKQRCQSCEVNKSIICCISAKSVAFKHSFIKSGQTIVIIFFSCYLFLLNASFRRSESQKVISTTFQFVPCFFLVMHKVRNAARCINNTWQLLSRFLSWTEESRNIKRDKERGKKKLLAIETSEHHFVGCMS